MLPSTLSDIPYGPHPRHKFDVWLPPGKGDGPFPFYLHIHGGGYGGGDKRPLNIDMLQTMLGGGVAVASCNYRFVSDPEYFAPLKDGQRALQFIRHHAAEYKLDKTRVALGGGSAGAATSFWLGFAPDRADPQSPDPVARESTRVTCIAAWEAQTTLDPLYFKKLLGGPTWTIGSISALTRLSIDQYDTPEGRERIKEIACTEWIDKDTPPVFLFNMTPNLPLGDTLEIGPGIHHPRIASALKEMLDPLGIECVLRTREEFAPDAPASEYYPSMFKSLGEFVVRHLNYGKIPRTR